MLSNYSQIILRVCFASHVCIILRHQTYASGKLILTLNPFDIRRFCFDMVSCFAIVKSHGSCGLRIVGLVPLCNSSGVIFRPLHHFKQRSSTDSVVNTFFPNIYRSIIINYEPRPRRDLIKITNEDGPRW